MTMHTGSGGYPGWFIDNVLVGEPSNVTGFVYNDLNSNCAFDGGDSLLPNISFGLTFSGPDLAIGYTPLPCIIGDTTILNLCFKVSLHIL